ncbi:hypothetical protein [Polaribacter sp. M15]
MKYRNLISNLWLMNSEGYKTKLNKDIIKCFPGSDVIHNSLGRGLPFVDFHINSVLIDVYKDIYRIDKEYKQAVQFKERFEEIKNKNKIGIGEMQYLDEKGKDVDEKIILYKGYFPCYVVILQHFFFCYFINNIRSNDSAKITSLNTFLQNEKKELAIIPYNYFIQHGFFEFRKKYTPNDVKEYVEIIIDLITDLKQKSVIDFKSLNDLDADSLFLNSQTRDFFCYIIEKNINKKNDAFFSKLHRYFKSRGYLKKEAPKEYFKFLNESKIYSFRSNQIQTPSTTNEEEFFNKLDQLLFQFFLNQ